MVVSRNDVSSAHEAKRDQRGMVRGSWLTGAWAVIGGEAEDLPRTVARVCPCCYLLVVARKGA